MDGGEEMSNVDISIIIPAYNAEKELPECVLSIVRDVELAKKLNAEIIIVVNGCKDNTKNCADFLCKKTYNFCRLLVLSSNKGVSVARNKGLKYAVGKYVFFVDADDSWQLGSMEHIAEDIKRDADLILYSYKKNNKFIRHCEKESFYNDDDLLSIKKWFFLNPTIRMNAWGKAFKRSLVVENLIYFINNLLFAEDGDFVIRFLFFINSIMISPVIIYNYKINLQSATNKMNYNRVNCYIKSMECSYEFINKKSLNLLDVMHVYVLIHVVVMCVHDVFNYRENIIWNDRIKLIKNILNNTVIKKALKNICYRNLFTLSLSPVLFFKMKLYLIGGGICYLKSILNKRRLHN